MHKCEENLKSINIAIEIDPNFLDQVEIIKSDKKYQKNESVMNIDFVKAKLYSKLDQK